VRNTGAGVLHPWRNPGHNSDESISLIMYIVFAQELIEINENFGISATNPFAGSGGLST
jgi:hypothetical protein